MEFESYSELQRRFPKLRLRGWDESVLSHFVGLGEIEADPDTQPTRYNVADVRHCLFYFLAPARHSHFNGEEQA